MKIFSYYNDVPGISALDSLKLICAWREHWSAIGFEPFVLSEFHARAHPYFAEFEAAVKKLPSVNGPDYEFACYARWLALAQVGGGFMADYDVFSHERDELGGAGRFPWPMTGPQLGKLHIFQNKNVCPCFVYASPEIALHACKAFATTSLGRREIKGGVHVSDQYIFEDLVSTGNDWIETHDLVRLWSDEGWEKFPFVHFANAVAAPAGKTPRWKFVGEILK